MCWTKKCITEKPTLLVDSNLKMLENLWYKTHLSGSFSLVNIIVCNMIRDSILNQMKLEFSFNTTNRMIILFCVLVQNLETFTCFDKNETCMITLIYIIVLFELLFLWLICELSLQLWSYLFNGLFYCLELYDSCWCISCIIIAVIGLVHDNYCLRSKHKRKQIHLTVSWMLFSLSHTNRLVRTFP